MPRRNRTPQHTPYHPARSEDGKTRYGSKRLAEKAAEERMLLKPELALQVYRGLDGGWYLTSTAPRKG